MRFCLWIHTNRSLLYSANGTFINGKLLGQNEGALIRNGDVISLLVAGVDSAAFNPEESVVYQYVECKDAPPMSLKERGAALKIPLMKPVAAADRHQKRASSMALSVNQPEDFVHIIKVNPSVEVLQALRLQLLNRKDSWLLHFIEIGGLDQLVDLVSVKSRMQIVGTAASDGTSGGEEEQAVLGLKCIKVVLGKKFGLEAALETKDFVKTLALCQESTNPRVRKRLPKMLAVICVLNATGHSLVLQAMDAVKTRRRDPQRFKGLVKWLSVEEDCALKAQLLTLINVIVNFPMDLHIRLSLREEFVALGIMDILSGLDMIDDPALNQQLNIFREEKREDDLEYSERYASTDPLEMMRRLVEKWKGTPSAAEQLSRVLSTLLKSTDPEAIGLVEKYVMQSAKSNWKVTPEVGRKMTPELAPKKAAAVAPPPPTAVNTEAMAALESRLRSMEEKHAGEMRDLQTQLAASESRARKEMEAIRLEKDVEIRRLRHKLETAPVATAPAPRSRTSGASSSSSSVPAEPGSPFSPVLAVLQSPTRGSAPPPPPPPFVALAPPPPPPPAVAAASLGALVSPRQHPSMATPGVATTTTTTAAAWKGMRKLHFPKIPGARIPGTIWETVGSSTNTKVNAGELEALFRLKDTGKAQASTTSEGVSSGALLQDDKVRFFDSKRANNIGIMMSQFKGVDVLGLVSAIRRCDETILNLERVTQLHKFCPNEEEEALLVAYEGPLDKLGKVELFFLNLLAVPRLRIRLEAMKFKLIFDEVACDVFTRLDAVTAASREVSASKSLVSVLGLVLAMGNYMNYGSFQVTESRGFDLTFLTRLEDTKSINDKTTFLHYLASVMEREGLTESLVDDLRSVEAAALVAFDPTVAELAALKQGLALIMKEVALAEKEGSCGDEFSTVFKEFHSIAMGIVQDCESRVDAVRNAMGVLRAKFGLTPTVTIEEIFAVLSNFLLGVQKCAKDNARDENMKRAAEKKAAKQANKKARPTRPQRPGAADVRQAVEAATLRMSAFDKQADSDATLLDPIPTPMTADRTLDENSNVTFNLSTDTVAPATPKRNGDAMSAAFKALQEGCFTGRRRKSAEGHMNDRRTLKQQASEQQLAAMKKSQSFQVTTATGPLAKRK